MGIELARTEPDHVQNSGYIIHPRFSVLYYTTRRVQYGSKLGSLPPQYECAYTVAWPAERGEREHKIRAMRIPPSCHASACLTLLYSRPRPYNSTFQYTCSARYPAYYRLFDTTMRETWLWKGKRERGVLKERGSYWIQSIEPNRKAPLKHEYSNAPRGQPPSSFSPSLAFHPSHAHIAPIQLVVVR